MLKFNVRNIFWNVPNAEGSRFYKQSTLSGGHGHQVGVSLTDYIYRALSVEQDRTEKSLSSCEGDKDTQ